MDIVDLTYQKDIAHWTWTIAFFLWFVGIAGMSSVAYLFTRNKALGLTILPAMVIGLLFVLSHLTRWWNLPYAVFTAMTEFTFNFQSWMFWGFVILLVHLVFAAVVAAANLDSLKRSAIGGILERLEGSRLFLAGFAFMGFIATAYSGFLISAASGIPLWNTALIPVLWVISGGVSAVALLELYHVFGWTDERVAHTGLRIELGLDVMKLLAILAFLYTAATVSTIGAQYGAQLMISGDLAMMTWVGIVGIGIIVPLVLGMYSLMFSERKPVLALSAIAALVGVLMLRATILLAGVWEPLVI